MRNADTEHEIEFIRGLGSWAPELDKSITRVKLLRGYLRGARRRTDWGRIDKASVMRFAQNESERAELVELAMG